MRKTNMKNRELTTWPVYHRAGIIEIGGIQWTTPKPESGNDAMLARLALQALETFPYTVVIDNPGEATEFTGNDPMETLKRISPRAQET